MSTQITRTKIIIPNRRSDLYTRPRLLELMTDVLDYRLFIIAAPAGYGKTSLLVDFAHQAKTPICWFSIDTLDRDFQRFVAHFVAAINRRFPYFGKQSQAVLRNARLNLMEMESLVSTLVNEAYEKIDEHFILVLDDFHLVETQNEINEFINRFIHTMDENIHVVISSRALLTLPDLPLLVARGQVGGLSFEELLFRPDEIQSLVLQNYHQTISMETARQVVEQSEGWITGVLLSSGNFLPDADGQLRVVRASGVDLYDFLAQQVLDQQPAHLREFLLRTSLLEEFDADLCREVLGPVCYPKPPNWRELINAMLRNNLFVLPVAEKDTWLRYHHIFRDFLQTRMQRERPAERLDILHRLAEVSTRRMEWDRAYSIYQSLQESDKTAELVSVAGSDLITAGRLSTLANWLEALPEAYLVSQPVLLSLWGSVAVMQGDIRRGLTRLDQAEQSLKNASDWQSLGLTLSRRAVARRFLGDFEGAIADSDQALALVQADSPPDIIIAEALRVKGFAQYQLGQVAEGLENLRRSRQMYELLENEYSMAMVDLELGITYRSMANHEEALSAYTRSLEFWRKTGNIPWQANLLNNLGVLYHEMGNYEAAAATLDEALLCAKRSRYTRMEAYALVSLGDIFADLQVIEAARDAYRQAGEVVEKVQEHSLRLYLDLAHVNLDRLGGDLAQGQNRLGWVRSLIKERQSGSEWAQFQLEAGRLGMDSANLDAAAASLQEAAQIYESTGQPMQAARAYLYLANVYYRKKQKDQAFHCLFQSLGQGMQLTTQQPLVVAGREMQPLLQEAQADPTQGRQAARLLERISTFENNLPRIKRHLRRKIAAVSMGAPRLVIRTLGRSQVMRDGILLSNRDWQTLAARNLFFYLVSQPGGVSREKISEAFWADLPPEQMRLQFKNTIYRLRHAIGTDVILYDSDSYWFNRSLDYDLDTENFRSRLEQAAEVPDEQEKLTLTQQALDLYQGDYLPDIDETWVEVERQSLHRLYVDASRDYAELQLSRGSHTQVLEDCERVLRIDPTQEEFHRLAMRAHAARGNRSGVIRQYEVCTQILRDELGVSPSEQTKNLYRLLTR